MRRRGTRWGWRLVVLASVLAGVPRVARAQEPPSFPDVDVDVNYVYATQLGFGGYRVGGLDATVFSLPITFTLMDVFENWRLKVSLPILAADYDFKTTVSALENVNEQLTVRAHQRTLSTEPKFKLEIPIFDWWTISPIGAFGVGAAFDNEVTAFVRSSPNVRLHVTPSTFWFYTYQVGISSLIQQRLDRWTLSLGNAFIYAGMADFHTDDDVQGYGSLQTGVEARHPLGISLDRFNLDASGFFIWYYFTPSLEFSRVLRDALEVDNLYEFGLTFGADDATPFEMPVLGNPRLGVSYRFGNDLEAVRLNFGFPF